MSELVIIRESQPRFQLGYQDIAFCDWLKVTVSDFAD